MVSSHHIICSRPSDRTGLRLLEAMGAPPNFCSQNQQSDWTVGGKLFDVNKPLQSWWFLLLQLLYLHLDLLHIQYMRIKCLCTYAFSKSHLHFHTCMYEMTIGTVDCCFFNLRMCELQLRCRSSGKHIHNVDTAVSRWCAGSIRKLMISTTFMRWSVTGGLTSVGGSLWDEHKWWTSSNDNLSACNRTFKDLQIKLLYISI